ncbi:MAG: L,D-transpeptidase [Thermomicrobium sp.]|nr:L,D-transpeptidase [Thermomicrobium sp.]
MGATRPSERVRFLGRCAIGFSCVAIVLLAWLPFPAVARAVAGGPDRVYFPETGHTVSFGFLDFWLRNGDVPIFGYPLSEELSEDGVTVQYFERAVFEWHPEAPAEWRVQLRRLGAEAAVGRFDRAFRPAAPLGSPACRYFPETEHNLCHGFRSFWERFGGVRVFGYPISEELAEDGLTVQNFERARLEWHPEFAGSAYEIQVSRLGAWAAQRKGIATAPVLLPGDVPTYDSALFPAVPSLVRTPPPGAPVREPKWIEVDLSDQVLRAWEFDRVVFASLVSTGLPQYPTPSGTFRVYRKLLFERMRGGTPGIDYYDLPNVPHTMYFYLGYALHGAYWHNNFGHPMSHGCVNLPLDAAAWLYEWTPLGTVVWIHP